MEQISIPFGVDARVEVVLRPGRYLYSGFHRGCIEIVQAVGPPVWPGLYEALHHLKVPIPVPGIDVRGIFPPTKPFRESLQRRDPCPEFVDIAAEVVAYALAQAEVVA